MPAGYLQLTGLSGLSSPERPGWIPIEALSWGVKLSHGESIFFQSPRMTIVSGFPLGVKDPFLEEIRTGIIRDQHAALQIKPRYLTESTVKQFMARELAGSQGVPGKILVSPGKDLVTFGQGHLLAYSKLRDGSIRIDLDFGNNWHVVSVVH